MKRQFSGYNCRNMTLELAWSQFKVELAKMEGFAKNCMVHQDFLRLQPSAPHKSKCTWKVIKVDWATSLKRMVWLWWF